MTDRPSNPTVAVVGCGYWGKNLVRNFHSLGALAAVDDADEAVSKDFASRYDVSAPGFDAILADSSISGVVLATPAEMHGEMAIRALEAGKHVFVEKPLALTVAEAGKVVDAAKAAGRTLMVGHLLQYHPVFLKLKEMVAAGELGDLQYIYSNRLNLGKVRREENILWSFAPHDISMILSLVGLEPDQVWSTGGNYLHENIADVTSTYLDFSGGVKAHVFVSWLHPFKEQKLVVVGSKAMAVFNDGEPWEGKLLLYPHRIEWEGEIPTASKAEAVQIKVAEDEPLKLECAHFLECISTGKTPRTDGEEGIRVLSVLEKAQHFL